MNLIITEFGLTHAKVAKSIQYIFVIYPLQNLDVFCFKI